MSATTKTWLSVLAVGLMLSGIPWTAGAQNPTCGSDAETYTFTSDSASGTYSAPKIHVPANVVVTVPDALVLNADCLILVEGQIIGQDAASTLASGASIHLQSGGDVIIWGRIVAGDGTDAPSATVSVPGSVGDVGGPGGNVQLTAGFSGALILHPSAYVKSGDGGRGGGVRAILASADPVVSTFDATGGAGGQGGALYTNAFATTIQGTLDLGAGGAGGRGYALVMPGISPPAGGGTVQAKGGMGGAAGTLTLPPGFSPFTLWQLGVLVGGEGGNTGPANAYGSHYPTSGDDATLDETNSDLYAAQCGQNPGEPGGDSGAPGVPGADGCQGWHARAEGQKGGLGLVGGDGEDVEAEAGTGGNGGRGGPGSKLNCTYYPGIFSDCQVHYGEEGGRGGHGGNAGAYGGQGGDGLIRGGQGGDAYARGGSGGTGGRGGTGGHGWVGGTWNGDLSYPHGQQVGCVKNWGGSAWLMCKAIRETSWGVCGYGGWGGGWGGRGGVTATPGAGGSAVLGSLIGGHGAPGEGTQEEGNFGSFGPDGSPANWPNGSGGNRCA